jgi:fucose permease
MRLAREPLVLLLAAAMFIYVGSELGLSSWTSEYFVKVLGAPVTMGALSLSALWVGLMCGRLAISFGYRGTRHEVILLILGVLCTLGLAGILLFRGQAAVMVLVFVTGLGYSGVYPLLITLVGRHHRSGVAVGAVTTGAGIGSLLFPLLMAVIAQRFGLRSGFLFYLGLDAAFLVLSLVVIRAVRRLPSA